jgi:hypothetical protein
MTPVMQAYRPKSRTTQLLVQELPDEILVYDMDGNEVHCLNGTAAKVWGLCDGEHTVAEIAALVAPDREGSTAETLVWVALEQFTERHLLEESDADDLPEAVDRGPSLLTRREMMVSLGLVVGMLPVVESIVSPPAALAASVSFGCSGVTDGLGSTPCEPEPL